MDLQLLKEEIIKAEKLAKETFSIEIEQDLFELKNHMIDENHFKELLSEYAANVINKYYHLKNFYKACNESFEFINSKVDNKMNDADRYDFYLNYVSNNLKPNKESREEIEAQLQLIDQLKDTSNIVYNTHRLKLKSKAIRSLIQKLKQKAEGKEIPKSYKRFQNYYIKKDSHIIESITARKDKNGNKNNDIFFIELRQWRDTWCKEITEKNTFDKEQKRRLKNFVHELILLTEKVVYFLKKIHLLFGNNELSEIKKGSLVVSLNIEESEIKRKFISLEYQKSFIVSLLEKGDYHNVVFIQKYSLERIDRILRHFKTWYTIDFYDTAFKDNFQNLISEIKDAANADEINILMSAENYNNQFDAPYIKADNTEKISSKNKLNENPTLEDEAKKTTATTFKEIFTVNDYEKYINALHQVENPVIDENWNFIGKQKGSKGVICNWIKELGNKGLINSKYNRQVLAAVCNNEIKDFNLGKDGKTFDNTSKIYDDNYKDLLLEIFP